MPTAAPAPTPALAPDATPTVLPNPSSPRRSTRERTATVRHSVANPDGDGGGLRQPAAGLHTELDDVFPVEHTHTCDGGGSVELTDISQPASNRFVLQLTSIAEESERSTDVCYIVQR